MKKIKKIGLLLLVATLFIISFAMVACDKNGGNKDNTTKIMPYEAEMLSKAENEITGYNSNLFYVNSLDFQVADPTVIYITEGEEKGWFYTYGTSDEIGCHGFQAWRSKDLSHWECTGVAFQPDYSVAWATNNYWAPEIIYDNGIYYLFYNAYNANDNNRLCLSVAHSTSPKGPFVSPDGIQDANGNMLSASKPVFDVTEKNPVLRTLKEEKASYYANFIKDHALDASPFIDPATGKKYMYFSYYDSYGEGSFVYGMEMKNWFTPDYSTLEILTYPFFRTVEAGLANDDSQKVEEGHVNEGPFMMYRDGKYYLTISIFGYTDPTYRVIQAISDSPLGPFRKLTDEEGGKVVSSDVGNWSHIVSAGHHCFFRCGEELFIAYHTFRDRNSIANGRALAVDKVVWLENSDGLPVMHTNGPTWSVQALPEFISGYKNIATSATITASNTASDSNVALLNDEIIKFQETDLATEYEATSGTSTIKLEWNDFRTVRALMVYNSIDYEKTFVNIAKATIEYKKADGSTATVELKNLEFDWDWHFEEDFEFMRPGGSVVAEFNELPVKSITLVINSPEGADRIAIGEIIVLGKDKACDGVDSFKEYSYTNATYGSPHVVRTSKTFGNIPNSDVSTWWGYDLSHDDGTENAYIENKGCFDQYAYFNSINDTQFYAEAEFTVTASKAFANDPYPKFGLAMSTGGIDGVPKNTIFFFVDAVNYTSQNVGCAQRKLDNSDWDWNATEQNTSAGGISYTGGNYVKLAALRIGKEFFLICNDKLAIYYDSFSVFESNVPCGVGFLSFNTPMKIKNYVATTDSAVLQEKFAQYGANISGERIGSAGGFRTTTGWDLTNDRTDSPSIVQSAVGVQFAYFKDINAKQFYAEMEISVTENMGDPYPKFGFALRSADTKRNFLYYIDGVNYTNKVVGFVLSHPDSTSDWYWGDANLNKSAAVSEGLEDYNGIDNTDDTPDTAKLKILRDGATIKMYVNDTLVLTAENIEGFGADDLSTVGMFTFTTGVTVYNHYATTDITGR